MSTMKNTNAIVGLHVIIILFISSTTVSSDNELFTGAVVEYNPIYVNTSSKTTVEANLEKYAAVVTELIKKFTGLKIIVFPERGLSSTPWLATLNKTEIYGEMIPDANKTKNLCESSDVGPVIKYLSCLAQNNSVYIAVNTVEKNQNNTSIELFNVNTVFSPTGALIAKYRKFNLYGFENKVFTKPHQPDTVIFKTDFGVTFGTFTCADIVFKSPALDLVTSKYNATHIVFPAAWKSELPYFTALQQHSSWAFSTNTVLLAAGLNDPTETTGSGIYLGRLSNSIYKNSYFQGTIQNQIKGSFAIISAIPKSLDSFNGTITPTFHPLFDKSHSEIVPLKVATENLNVYSTKIINDSAKIIPESEYNNITLLSKTRVNETVCNRGFCCEFVFNMTKKYTVDVAAPHENVSLVGDRFGQYKYSLAVFNGARSFESGKTIGVQVCSVISCLDENGVDSCAKRTNNVSPNKITEFSGYKYIQMATAFEDIEIKANFSTKNDSLVTTNILLSSEDYIWLNKSNDYIEFGRRADAADYTFSITGNNTVKGLTQYTLQSKGKIIDPATISLYNRYFDLDGKPETTNMAVLFNLSTCLLTISLFISVIIIQIH